jgi:hypothetical protein
LAHATASRMPSSSTPMEVRVMPPLVRPANGA